MKASDMYNKWKIDYDDKANRIWNILINDLISILEEKHDDYDFCCKRRMTKLSHSNSTIVYLETKFGTCQILYRGSEFWTEQKPSSMSLSLDRGGISQNLSLDIDNIDPKIERLVQLLENYWNSIENIEYMESQKYVYNKMSMLLSDMSKENENE